MRKAITKRVDVAVIGGGPAGLAAAISARREGADRVVILERDRGLGGILQQCIHTGFGTRILGEDLTGPEYAERYVGEAERNGVEVKLETMILEVSSSKIVGINQHEGPFSVDAKSIVLAMGCRERPRGAFRIPGTRPAGVFTAGTAQWYVNVLGYVPGKRVVVLGSGDVGLIMARRLTLEGATVEAVVELMAYPGGLSRNVVQCLLDFNIPLILRHTVTCIHGRERVEGVTIAQVDENNRLVAGTEKFISCDTLLLSVGLIPENELSRKAGILIDQATGGPVVDETFETSSVGVFGCGNVVHVHDLVDDVSEDGDVAGRYAGLHAMGKSLRLREHEVLILKGRNVRYVVPQKLRWATEKVTLSLRVREAEDRVRIRLASRGDTLMHVPQLRVRPGEMLKLVLTNSSLERLHDELVVGVEKEEDS